MSNYDIYLNGIHAIRKSTSMPVPAMTREQFAANVAAAERNEPQTFTSLIDMDAFEAAYRA